MSQAPVEREGERRGGRGGSSETVSTAARRRRWRVLAEGHRYLPFPLQITLRGSTAVTRGEERQTKGELMED
jgi:hypothetical protein